MKIQFTADWRRWRKDEIVDCGEGVAGELIAMRKAVRVDVETRENTSMFRKPGRPKKDDK